MARTKLLLGRAIQGLIDWAETASPQGAFRFKRHFYRPDMAFALALLRQCGFRPQSVVDVGAYHGDWTRQCRRVFPEASVLMVEPSASRVAALQTLSAADPNVRVAQALLAAAEGAAHFCEDESNSRIVESPANGAAVTPTTTLDQLLSRVSFAPPQLLKVDVQGYDLDVLMGGLGALASTEIVIVELSLIPLHPHAPSFRTAIEWFDDHGFRLLDIAGFIRRPLDDALWQMDAVFARRDSPYGRAESGWAVPETARARVRNSVA